MSTKTLRWAALVFAGVALIAGGLQLLAFGATGVQRHLIVGIFALAVGLSVFVAAVRKPGGGGDSGR